MGQEVYRNLFFILANLDFSPGEATSHWQGLLETWDDVNQILGQPIDIRVAVLHYFLEIDRKLKNPTIVEMRILREVKAISDPRWPDPRLQLPLLSRPHRPRGQARGAVGAQRLPADDRRRPLQGLQ